MEVFVCPISTSPQEISYDGKFWGNFLSDRMLEGADNRGILSPRPQQLKEVASIACCFLVREKSRNLCHLDDYPTALNSFWKCAFFLFWKLHPFTRDIFRQAGIDAGSHLNRRQHCITGWLPFSRLLETRMLRYPELFWAPTSPRAPAGIKEVTYTNCVSCTKVFKILNKIYVYKVCI